MAINLNGILLPITTPFTPGEDLDAAGLESNLAKWNDAGVAGYVVLGSTGERANLDEAEYLQVIEMARRTVPQNLTFIADNRALAAPSKRSNGRRLPAGYSPARAAGSSRSDVPSPGYALRFIVRSRQVIPIARRFYWTS